MDALLAAAILVYVILAWLRPCIALGVLLFLIPFGHLVRFAIGGVPFTFPEVAVYALAAAMLLRAKSEIRNPKSETISKFEFRKLGFVSSFVPRVSIFFRDPWFLLPFLWLFVAAVSAAYSPNALRAWGIWKGYCLAPVVLFWVIRCLTQRPEESASVTPPSSFRATEGSKESHITAPADHGVRSLGSGLGMTSAVVLPLALGAFLVAAIAIAQRWWPIGVPYPWSVPGKFRATSVFGYPNAVGLYLAPLVPLFLGATRFFYRSLRGARSATKQSRPPQDVRLPRSPAGSLAMTTIFGGAAVLAVLAIWFAKSTGALVALAVALLLSLLLWGLHRRPLSNLSIERLNNGHGGLRALVVIVFWIVACLLLTLWLPNRNERTKWGPPIVQKLTFQKWSGSVRLAQYRETWALLRDHPIRGAGLAGYQAAIAPYHEKQDVEIFLYPHNLLLAIWVELGLAGLLIFLATVYQFFRAVFSIQYSVFSIAMIVLLLHGLVDVPYFKNDLAMMFWVIVAFGTACPMLGTIVSYGRPSPADLPPSAPRDC